MTSSEVIEIVMSLFGRAGKNAYFGESVTQTEHALQCAHLAASSGAGADLITAALLHDVGHLLCGLAEDAAVRGIDDTHENYGTDWLDRYFGADVITPVRLHVTAKRYLCCIDTAYLAGLSSASQLSLRLQGGPFTMDQARHFEREPYFVAAVAVRRWDDLAKVPGLDVPALDHYRPALASALRQGGKVS